MSHYVNITAVNGITNSAGEPMGNGVLTITPVDNTGRSIACTLDDSIFITADKITRVIKNGVLQGTALKLADGNHTNPAHIGFNFDIVDSSTFEKTTYLKVQVEPDVDGNYDLASLPSTSLTTYPIVYRTGPPGPSGALAGSFRFTQSSPSTTWVVTHNLGYLPSITIFDSAGTLVHGAVFNNTDNQLTITFGSAFSGTAYLI